MKFLKNILKKIYKLILVNIYLIIYPKPLLSSKINYSGVLEKKIKINSKEYKICKIINGRLFTDNSSFASYISKNNLLLDISYQFFQQKNSLTSLNGKLNKNSVLYLGTPKKIKYIKKPIFSLLSGGAAKNNFAHWFLDTIPKIYLFKKAFPKAKIKNLLVPSLKYNFQRESLKLLGFKKDNIYDAKKFKHLRSNLIYAASHPCNFFPEKVPRWNILFIRKTFLKYKNLKLPKFERVYIDRDQTKILKTNNLDKFKLMRVLLNGEDIKKFLKEYDFKIIKPEMFSLPDQIAIYNNAKVILGLLGAAMYMTSLCKKNSNIIEIGPEKGSNEFLRISKFCETKYFQIKLKPIIDPGIYTQQGILNCPINKIENIFKLINLKKN